MENGKTIFFLRASAILIETSNPKPVNLLNLALHDDLDEDMQPCKTEYVERVNTHFIDFKDHPLLTFIRNDENIGIDFSTDPGGMHGQESKAFHRAPSQCLSPEFEHCARFL